MKKFIFAIGLLMTSSVFALGDTNISMNASAEIITPITLQVAPLEFGTLVKPQSGRTDYQATALLEISGEKQQTVKITIPNRMNIVNGSDSLRVNLSIPTTQKRLNNQGEASLNITGSLRVAANTKAGDYTGSATITASYL
ncbi:DUF4402 domain-containing protein [Piscirickettsia litoralis]|uniref:DUF4402 domain-containing protein n=1 Tax=Piscirickettsia litoralis TaxID=1891921 RepID=A0ABX3A4H5_9GAMM|nr:DUF4402 domain-containing protein [Piscirickettsia litoralis]ODN43509.1 hypothetical protein BGC07_12000 [Piscirickettsia litoralis]